MAASFRLSTLPPWALYGGAGVAVGGGYLLYRKRKLAAASASSSTSPTTLDTSGIQATGASAQQSSVVPYYLTSGTSDTSGTATQGRRPPPVPGAGIPAPAGSGRLPDIPPLLPVAPTAPDQSAPTAPSTPAPTPPPPAPVADQNIPPNILQQIQANGEQIISSIRSPNGGTWYLGNLGGVFAEGGAPFLGSARNYGFAPGTRTAISIVPNGNGYTVISNRGEQYAFPG